MTTRHSEDLHNTMLASVADRIRSDAGCSAATAREGAKRVLASARGLPRLFDVELAREVTRIRAHAPPPRAAAPAEPEGDEETALDVVELADHIRSGSAHPMTIEQSLDAAAIAMNDSPAEGGEEPITDVLELADAIRERSGGRLSHEAAMNQAALAMSGEVEG